MQPTAGATAAAPGSTTSNASLRRLARLLSSLREVKNAWRDLAAGGLLERQLTRLTHDLAAVTRRADERTA